MIGPTRSGRSAALWSVDQDVAVRRAPADEIERVYREQGAKLWRSLYAFTGNREVASDALAEALAQALARGDGIRSPARWIWASAFRIAAGELKHRSRNSPMVDHTYEMSGTAEELVAALRRITPRQRAVVILHLYAGYPNREIAAMLGTSAATVRVHLSQGRRRLRSLLEDRDG
jgi:RNA polymerase sigma-70 factor, ECF subfamily